jgi:two-component system, OmpR family, sensor histidine kinase KdpD
MPSAEAPRQGQSVGTDGARPCRRHSGRDRLTGEPRAPLLFYLLSASVIVLAASAAYLISWIVPDPQVAVLFLAAVFACAILWGLGPSLFAAALAVAVKSFFFYRPIFSFRVDDPRQLLDLGVFAVVAVLTSNLAAQTRRQTDAAVQREANIAILHTFSGRLAGIAPVHDLYLAIVEHLGRAFGHEVVLLVPSNGRLAIVADRLHDRLLTGDEIALAEGVWRAGPAVSTPGAATMAGRWELLRLSTARGSTAVLAIDRESHLNNPLADEKIHAALLDQAAVAIERALLATSLEEARIRAKAEELRDAVISAISHDLQTPLASIIGAVSALRRFGPLYDESSRGELIATIHEEAERLDHFIRSVLDLTRIRADAMQPRLEAVELSDIVNAALQRTEAALTGREVTVALRPGLPMLKLDVFLMERALVNLIENAIKYSPAGQPIRISAQQRGAWVDLDVSDRGIGIASEDRERIFGEFVRVGAADAKSAGTGLGLAIVKAFVGANGGSVETESAGRGAGATFRIKLPVASDIEEPAA